MITMTSTKGAVTVKKIISVLLSIVLSVNLLTGMYLLVSANEEDKAPGIMKTIPETQEPTESKSNVQPLAEYPDSPDDGF